jgi:hypothetical protein
LGLVAHYDEPQVPQLCVEQEPQPLPAELLTKLSPALKANADISFFISLPLHFGQLIVAVCPITSSSKFSPQPEQWNS